jgi:hypothetical protein
LFILTIGVIVIVFLFFPFITLLPDPTGQIVVRIPGFFRTAICQTG